MVLLVIWLDGCDGVISQLQCIFVLYPVLVMSLSMGAAPKNRYMRANDFSHTTKTANASPSVVNKHSTVIPLSIRSQVWAIK